MKPFNKIAIAAAGSLGMLAAHGAFAQTTLTMSSATWGT